MNAFGYLGTFGGLQVHIHHMPPQYSHHEPCRYTVHPLISWLSKFLPIDPWIDGQRPVFKDVNPVVIGGKLYVSLKQYEELRRATK